MFTVAQHKTQLPLPHEGQVTSFLDSDIRQANPNIGLVLSIFHTEHSLLLHLIIKRQPSVLLQRNVIMKCKDVSEIVILQHLRKYLSISKLNLVMYKLHCRNNVCLKLLVVINLKTMCTQIYFKPSWKTMAHKKGNNIRSVGCLLVNGFRIRSKDWLCK